MKNQYEKYIQKAFLIASLTALLSVGIAANAAVQDFVYDIGGAPIPAMPSGTPLSQAWQSQTGWYYSQMFGYVYTGCTLSSCATPMYPWIYSDTLGMGLVSDSDVVADWIRVQAKTQSSPTLYFFVQGLEALNVKGAWSYIDGKTFSVANKSLQLNFYQTLGFQSLATTTSQVGNATVRNVLSVQGANIKLNGE